MRSKPCLSARDSARSGCTSPRVPQASTAIAAPFESLPMQTQVGCNARRGIADQERVNAAAATTRRRCLQLIHASSGSSVEVATQVGVSILPQACHTRALTRTGYKGCRHSSFVTRHSSAASCCCRFCRASNGSAGSLFRSSHSLIFCWLAEVSLAGTLPAWCGPGG